MLTLAWACGRRQAWPRKRGHGTQPGSWRNTTVASRATYRHWLGLAVLATAAVAGCASPNGRAQPEASGPVSSPPAVAAASNDSDPVQVDDPFAGVSELPLDRLIEEVQARNPSLQAATEAWRASAQRYPQVVSLDDPMFGFMVAPRGIGTDGGWMVEASQKVPWACKRSCRGTIAQAEADAARGEIGDARLMLAAAAKMAYFDYYLARRQLAVNADTAELVRQFRDIAKHKYESGQATQQDVLQSEVELADLEGRRAGFVRDERVAAARINTLLHRAADHPLPPPPARVDVPDALPPCEALQDAALQSRPDLYAQAARIRAEEAAVALACQEFYPDLELVGKYDALMPEDMRAQVGVRLSVPLQRQRRWAAVQEAQARLARERAEYQGRLDRVQLEVQTAYEQTAEAQKVAHLYVAKIVPAAEQNLKSAQANYVTGKADFLRLVDAERQLNGQQEKHFQTIAEYHRRAAELERAVGGPLPETAVR
jgi:outer membrane protein, heavy metal efflux system